VNEREKIMNDEQKKESRIVDKKDEQKDKPRDPYATSASVGGFIGAIAGYIVKRTGLLVFGFWEGSLFVGGAAVAGALVAVGGCYIWKRFLKRFYK
jgi:hypothetical protein